MLPQAQLQQILDTNNKILEEIKPFLDRKVAQLPEEIQEAIHHHITLGKTITSSGIESVQYIHNNLIVFNHYLEKAINDPQQFDKLYGNKNTDLNSKNKQLDITKPQTKPVNITKTVNPASPTNSPKITIKLDNSAPSPTTSTVPTNPPQKSKITL